MPRNTDAIPQPDTGDPSKNDSVFVPFGAAWWAYAIRPYDQVRVPFRNTDAILQPATCDSSKNCPVFVPFGAAYEAYSIRPYDWVCAILRNTDAIPQPGTCCPSKNCPVFVPFGAAYEAYSIRPYDWVRAALRKTVPFSSPSGPLVGRIQYAPTAGYVRPFKKLSHFRPLRGRLVSICDTPLQPGTDDPSKYGCDSPIGYVLSLGIRMCFPDWRRLRVGDVGL